MSLSFYNSKSEIDNDDDFKEEDIKTSINIDNDSINVNEENETTNDDTESNIIAGNCYLISVY